MKSLRGQIALLTGASGGLGTYIAHALADAGTDLALVAYPGVGLEELHQSIVKAGRRAIFMPSDLRVPEQQHYVVEQTRKEFGRIDLLVNNAGVEFTSAYHDLTEAEIRSVLAVNLDAPMLLSRLVLPEMLERGCGHIVNVSSLAGKSSPAYQEPYAASKAGLIAFTASLRATYYGTGVSASAICPGFVEAGIYARLKTRSGVAAPAILGTSSPEAVARAVIRAIENDLPEVIINPYPVRPLFALTALFPRLGAWLIRRTGAHDFFRRVIEAEKSKRN